ncbi:syntaxin binding protein 1 [Coemansia sp. RSA 2322]|nr:syntaxin binding protein 1 [Coemansia sp. RSA 2322]
MAANLLQSRRQEFFNALTSVRPSNRFKVVVVDRRSLNVLNQALKLPEILEHDVARIEMIENGRKDDTSMEAVYFLTPSKQSVARLIGDFGGSLSSQNQRAPGGRGGYGAPPASRQPVKYRAAHIYFTSELPDNLLALVKGSGITPYIKALKEMCIEYDVSGSRVFLTKLVDRPFYRLYSPVVVRGFNDELEVISKKLANVCGALKENPVVRYLLLDPETHGDTKARPLAFLFHTEMERIREVLPAADDDASRRKSPTELIIVDRSADPFAPVLHEFTYEAMVHDLLEIEDGNRFSYMAQLANGTEELKTVVLDESDSVWQEFRYQHISDAQQGIMKKFQALVGSNRAIANMQAGERVDLNRMRDVVNNMPQFNDQMSLIAAHITIMQRCMDQFEKQHLNDLALLEQNLVVGMTPDGDKYKSGDIDIAYVLNNPSIESENKLRALLLFFISNPNLTEPERLKLVQLAKLSREARETVKSMGMVIRWAHALDLLKQIKQRPSQQAKGGGISKWGLASMRAAATGSSQPGDDEPKPYDVSRYVPAFKSILEGCVDGNLSEDLFPYVVPPERPRDSGGNALSARSTPSFAQGERTGSPVSSMWSNIANSVGLQTAQQQQDSRSSSVPLQGSNNAQRQIKSLRSARPTWQKRDSTPSVASPSSGSSGAAGGMAGITSATAAMSLSPPATPAGSSRHRQEPRGRVILFVIGGVTYSEVRAAEEISAKYGREVIVGSTHMVEPSSYLKDISSLAFEIIGDNGRVLDMQPSFCPLGYGGPPDVDPLSRYDEVLAKHKPKIKAAATRTEEYSQRRAQTAVADDGDSPGRRRSRSNSRSRSRGRGRQAEREAAAAEYKPYENSKTSHQQQQQQQQQRSGGRAGAYPSSSSSASEYRDRDRDHYRQQPAEQQRTMTASSSRGSLRAASSTRSGASEPPGGASYGNSSNHSSREHSTSSSRQAHYPSHSDRGPAGNDSQNFRAGYEEYRQQQQHQQASRSRAAHHVLPNPSSARSSPQPPPPPHMQHAPRQAVAPPLSKEDAFRAKFEQSQSEWNAQKLNTANVNPANIPDMHKVSLLQSGSGNGSGGRGRSGSAVSNEKKPSFLKRML